MLASDTRDATLRAANRRLSIAFLLGATTSAVASIAATLAIVPEDLPGRAPSDAELAVLALWLLALGLGHRWSTRRVTVSATLGATLHQMVWGGAAFLLLASLTMLVAPVLTIVATRMAAAMALTEAHFAVHLLLLIPMGVLLALGTGAATGSFFKARA